MGRLANIFRQSGCRSFAEAGWQPVGQVGSHFIVVKSGRPRQSFHSAAPRAVGGYIAQSHPCVRHDSRGFLTLVQNELLQFCLWGHARRAKWFAQVKPSETLTLCQTFKGRWSDELAHLVSALLPDAGQMRIWWACSASGSATTHRSLDPLLQLGTAT